MNAIVPPSRPLATRESVLRFIDDGRPLPAFPFLLGRRGYFGDTMGVANANDINIYDDALWLVEQATLTPWNANCDPGRHARGMENLTCGRWLYRPGIHNLTKDPDEHPHYEALVQAAPVTVRRDDVGDDTGYFGINIHRGGTTVTSSLGCQTIPPTQWDEVMSAVHRALARVGRDEPGRNSLTYILTGRYP